MGTPRENCAQQAMRVASFPRQCTDIPTRDDDVPIFLLASRCFLYSFRPSDSTKLVSHDPHDPMMIMNPCTASSTAKNATLRDTSWNTIDQLDCCLQYQIPWGLDLMQVHNVMLTSVLPEQVHYLWRTYLCCKRLPDDSSSVVLDLP